MKKTHLLTLIIIFISIQACREILPNKLPPITAEGRNTFGYEADGKVQEGCVEGLWQSAHSAEMPDDTTFTLAGTCNSHTLSLLLRKNEKLVEGINYMLTDDRSYILYRNPTQSFRSNRTDEADAFINFHKIDIENKIVAGTFSGTVFSEEGESIEITNGRFDKILK